jgi:hypothetical protein
MLVGSWIQVGVRPHHRVMIVAASICHCQSLYSFVHSSLLINVFLHIQSLVDLLTHEAEWVIAECRSITNNTHVCIMHLQSGNPLQLA